MALQVRRVVTGHDGEGRAIVTIDEMSQNLRSARPKATACVVWTSQGFPIDNTGEGDEGLRETGELTHLKAGDVVVQRGTVHNWINRGTEPCVIAFVLIAAKPVEAGGKVLAA